MWNKDKLLKIQKDYDDAMLSYNTAKYILIACIFGVFMSFIFRHGEAILFVFTTIGFCLYFFHCKDKLKKAERVMDDACKSLFGKRYKESKSDFINEIYK